MVHTNVVKARVYSTTLLVLLLSCGEQSLTGGAPKAPAPKPTVTKSESRKTCESQASADQAQGSADGTPFSAVFKVLDTDLVVRDKAPFNVEMEFSDTSAGTWSLYLSEQHNGLVGSTLLAKDLPLTQATFSWDMKDVAPGSYHLTAVVDFRDQTRVYQPKGQVLVADANSNSAPFVKILSPNNTFRLGDDDEVELIERNRDRARHPLGEPLRIVYQALDLEEDDLTLRLEVSVDNLTWNTLLDNVQPESPVDENTGTRVLTWTPPLNFDKNMYTLRLTASDGKAEGFAVQQNIGIGDVTWDNEIQPLFAQYCATAGCHDSQTRANRRDYTSYDDYNNGNREIRGTASHRDFDVQLVNYWQEPVGTQNRDRRAMPRGGPLPPAVLGKFLIWDMNAAEWRPNDLEYRGNQNGRKLRN